MRLNLTLLFLGFTMLFPGQVAFSQAPIDEKLLQAMDETVRELMDNGDIPGLSLALVNGDQRLIRNYGYSDAEKQIPVNEHTLFEIGSCSKAFTAMGVMLLVEQEKLDLDKKVVDYLPWFLTTFEGEEVAITVRQLLHHTGGIPWSTIAQIPESDDDHALEMTVRKLIGQELNHLPGTKYEYATINYDVLARIIEVITNTHFESFLQEEIIDRIGMSSTSIGLPKDDSKMATGHKVEFWSAHEYGAPVYRGNYPAGYVISNAADMAEWLKFQMGMTSDTLYAVAKKTHVRDRSVPLHDMSAYAAGWEVSLNGTEQIYHTGLNPNFTSYVAFRKKDSLGLAIMANSNSNHTSYIGGKIMRLLKDEKLEREYDPGDGGDTLYSSVSIAISCYILMIIGVFVRAIDGIIRKKRTYEPISGEKVRKLFGVILLIAPFMLGIYLLPRVMADFTWEAVLVWTPVSFYVSIVLLLVAVAVSYVLYMVGMLFPEQNTYRRRIPLILLVTALSGLSNVFVIIMVTSAIGSDVDIKYLIFYYVLIGSMYLLGRRFVQINLIQLTQGLVYDLRVDLIKRAFSTSFEKFERMDRGRVYTALNDDVNTIGGSTNLFISLATSSITALGAFLFLGSLAFWATVLAVFVILLISFVYYRVSQSTNKYFEQARDSRDVFMRLINGMIDGYKELSLHHKKKQLYKEDVDGSAAEFKTKISTAEVKFTNAFLVGESFLVVLLGFVSIGMAELFPNVRIHTIMRFIVVFLYLIGPVNSILNAVPNIMVLKVAWRRVQKFIKEIPANSDQWSQLTVDPFKSVSLEVQEVSYHYKSAEAEAQNFHVGPISFKANSGEILFIVGGNGSGKTTLAKMLTGLYQPDKGCIMIDGEVQKNFELGEYFSVVFTPPHLFEKLYDIDIENGREDIAKYLEKLGLQDKVKVDNGQYSTINLSGGQRKRLALLQCYLEDSPIYLFDEWAADQDPTYRKFFYHELLPEMKSQGKIVIAITHDDNYFSVADRILKMDQGELKEYTSEIFLESSAF